MPISSTDLNKAYLAYFGRPSDISGRATFANKELADVVSAFDSSAESKALYGDSIVNKINAIYVNLFNRDAEPAGLQHWLSKVMSGELTPAGVAIAILNGAQNDDAKAVANKLAAADAFTKAIDTTAEMQGYSGMAAVNSARAFLKAVDATEASLTAAVKNADTAVATATNAGSAQANQGQTFTLTTGIDNFKGAAGDDTFIGGNGAANTTGPADQLNGGAGTDTFKFYGGVITNAFPTLKAIEDVYLNATSGNVDLSGNADVVSVEVEAAAGAHVLTLASTQALKLTNINAGVSTQVLNTAAKGITLNNVVDKSVTPNVAQTLDVATRDASLTLTATGSASNIALNNTVSATSLTSLNVLGDAAITIAAAAAYTNLTTVDASKNTAGVDFTQGVDTNLTFTGGAGADRVNVAIATNAVNALDKLDGGAGIDTLAINTGGLTANAVANIKNFEILEVRGSTTQDASVFAANNTFTGLKVVNTGAAQTFSVTNLAATAKDNIVINEGVAANTTALTVTIKDFVSGGTSDSATVTANANAGSTVAARSATILTFDNVDVLNLVSKGTLATNGNAITLNATDVEKVVVTGNIATTLTPGATITGITEVDASGLVVANGLATGLTFAQAGGATQSILVTGTNGLDTISVSSAKGTVVANGGNDSITFLTASAALGDQSVNLSAKDFVAGGAVGVSYLAGSAGKAIINFSSDIEAKLVIGGVNLATTGANQTVGAAINGQNNVALVAGVLQFDVNGDGTFNAADDLAITLTGVNTTVTYNAAADYFVLA